VAQTGKAPVISSAEESAGVLIGPLFFAIWSGQFAVFADDGRQYERCPARKDKIMKELIDKYKKGGTPEKAGASLFSSGFRRIALAVTIPSCTSSGM
jgi:hypothetical protein